MKTEQVQLSELASAQKDALRHFATGQRHMQRALEAAWACGQALTIVKIKLAHGSFQKWTETSEIGYQRACKFLRIRKSYSFAELAKFRSIRAALQAIVERGIEKDSTKSTGERIETDSAKLTGDKSETDSTLKDLRAPGLRERMGEVFARAEAIEGRAEEATEQEIGGLETDAAEVERDAEALARDMRALRLSLTDARKAA